MKAKFTQGKWNEVRLLNDPEFSHEIGVSVKDEDAIACVFGFNKSAEEAEANTRLIAAAPDMLEVLQEMEYLIRHKYEIPLRLVIKTQAAIKKATTE